MRNERETMQEQLNGLIQAIKDDYFKWTSRNGTKELTEVNKNMIAEFNSKITLKEGQKYIKVISGSSVWGFIAKSDFNKGSKCFSKGDILKAAGWQAPALNAARGNIFDDDYTIQWTGPLYLN